MEVSNRDRFSQVEILQAKRAEIVQALDAQKYDSDEVCTSAYRFGVNDALAFSIQIVNEKLGGQDG